MKIEFSCEEVTAIILAHANAITPESVEFNTIKTSSYMPITEMTVSYEAPTKQENEAQ